MRKSENHVIELKDAQAELEIVKNDLERARKENKDTGPLYSYINRLKDDIIRLQKISSYSSTGSLTITVEEAMEHNQFLISGSTVSEKRGEHLKTYKTQ